MSGNEFWLWSDDGFAQDGPPWLNGSRWPQRGESLLSIGGLLLDLAAVFMIVATIASIYEWWTRRRWQYPLRCLLGAFLIIAMGLGWWRHSMNEHERDLRATTALREGARCLVVYW